MDKEVRTLSRKVDKCKPLSQGRSPTAGVAGRRDARARGPYRADCGRARAGHRVLNAENEQASVIVQQVSGGPRLAGGKYDYN